MDSDARIAYFEALLGNTRDNIYFKDLESRFLLVSQSMADWFHLPGVESFVGKTDADLFAPEHAREARADEESLIRGERATIVKEERELWPDGRTTWVSTVKLPLKDSDGRIIGTFGISRDITRRKQVEEGLVASDQRLREMESILNRSPAVVFHWKFAPGWPVLYVSENVRQFGYVPEEFLSGLRNYGDLIHPDDQAGVDAQMDNFVREKRTEYQLTYRIICRDRAIRWVEERGIIRESATSSPGDCQGIVLDVTDRHEAVERIEESHAQLEQRVRERTAELQKTNALLEEENVRRRQSEEQLRLSEQRYRRLLESVTSYVYTVTLENGRPVRTEHGPGCEAVTGYRPEDYQTHSYLWIDMVHADDRETVRNHATRVLEGAEPPSLEHRIRHKDGSIRWVRNTVVARRDPRGRLAGYDGLIQDITERHNAQEALIKAEREALQARQAETLERADRLSALGTLAAGVAHEVNNPLQGMLTHLDAVRRGLPHDFSRVKSIEMVERGIESIASLVQRLLWLSNTGGDESAGVCHFSDAVSFVSDLLRAQLEKRNVRLVVQARTLHARLAIPHREMVQIMINLIMNARDAMPNGGAITLSCDREGADALIRIRDTGIGIPPENLTRIFTPFFTTKGVKGTGLGLCVADSILRAHRGSIGVESRLNEGTVFILRIPLAETSP